MAVAVGLGNFINLFGGPNFPILIAIDFKKPAGDLDRFQLVKRNVAPLGVDEILVQDGESPKNVLAVILGDVPIAVADEKMQIDQFFLERGPFGFIESGNLLQLLFGWLVPHTHLPWLCCLKEQSPDLLGKHPQALLLGRF